MKDCNLGNLLNSMEAEIDQESCNLGIGVVWNDYYSTIVIIVHYCWIWYRFLLPMEYSATGTFCWFSVNFYVFSSCFVHVALIGIIDLHRIVVP